MAPSLETFFTTGGDPIEILGNPAPLYNYEMIIQFLDLDIKSRVIEETSSCDEFRKQVSEFEKKYSVSFSQLFSVKQAVMDMSLSVHNSIPGLDPFVSMDLGDMMRQAGIRNWRNEGLQIGESSRILDQTIHGLDSFVSMDLGDMTRQGGIRDREGRNQDMPLGESSNILDNVVNTNAEVVVNTNVEVQRMTAASDVADPAHNVIELQLLSQNEATESRIISAPKSVKLGKTFFPLTVQAGLTLLTIFFSSAGSEAKQLVNVAAGGNMVGYIGCLSEISLHKTNAKAAKIMGRIGSTAAVFGFTSMMGSLLAHKPAVSIGIAAIVTLVFFVVVAKL